VGFERGLLPCVILFECCVRLGKEVVSVGITYVEGVVTGPTGKQATLRFLVDSGATYTPVPHDVSKALDLAPNRTVAFTLADGTIIERAVSECHIALPEGEGHTPVILGEPGDEALLGVVTLENLGLILHPFKRTLEPMRMLLAGEGAIRPDPALVAHHSQGHTDSPRLGRTKQAKRVKLKTG